MNSREAKRRERAKARGERRRNTRRVLAEAKRVSREIRKQREEGKLC